MNGISFVGTSEDALFPSRGIHSHRIPWVPPMALPWASHHSWEADVKSTDFSMFKSVQAFLRNVDHHMLAKQKVVVVVVVVVIVVGLIMYI